MRETDEPFNWRAFWADLLQGSGRALLTLDGSDEARAAMAGFDYFDAAQDRRAERARNPADEDPSGPSSATQAELARERGRIVRGIPARGRHNQAGLGHSPATATLPFDPAIFATPRTDWASFWPSGVATPTVRPTPMSANPYDFDGLPVQVSFPPIGLPVIRRR